MGGQVYVECGRWKEENDMRIRSRAFMQAAKRKPHFLLIPFIPLGLTVSSFVLSLLAFRRVRRLSSATAAG
jgi:hypothetical protein